MDGSTILVVDDDPASRHLLTTVLGHAGHAVTEAADGAEALAAMQSLHPALVISDILMPAMDGYEFVRQLRANPHLAATPVMFWTANYFEREARGLARSCGVDHVLTKPCEPQAILDAVHHALGQTPTARSIVGEAFDREHLRVMTDKLSAKVRELEATQQRLGALLAIGHELPREHDLPSLVAHFTRAGRDVIAAGHTTVALLDEAGDRLDHVSIDGVEVREPLRAADAARLTEPVTWNAPVREREFLGVPIVSRDRVYGTICFAGKVGGDAFTVEDERVALTLASLFAVAYENARRLETLRRQNDTLEERVARRTLELQRSNEDLEQFAYIASHDLQEPLRMVSSYTQLLERRYKGRLDADADEFIGYAVDGAARMQALIQDLLAYSRVNRPASASPIRLDAAVDEALARLSYPIEETGATITRDPLPTLLADGPRLVQLFQNLVGNALKFRSEAAPVVHISAARTSDGWTVGVRDNGIGIAPEYRDRVFTIFQRLHGRVEYPGTGVGLAICKRIVTQLGGRIWVESEPGRGSTFYFTVPVSRVKEA